MYSLDLVCNLGMVMALGFNLNELIEQDLLTPNEATIDLTILGLQVFVTLQHVIYTYSGSLYLSWLFYAITGFEVVGFIAVLIAAMVG